jgi:hypothetical protein
VNLPYSQCDILNPNDPVLKVVSDQMSAATLLDTAVGWANSSHRAFGVSLHMHDCFGKSVLRESCGGWSDLRLGDGRFATLTHLSRSPAHSEFRHGRGLAKLYGSVHFRFWLSTPTVSLSQPRVEGVSPDTLGIRDQIGFRHQRCRSKSNRPERHLWCR